MGVLFGPKMSPPESERTKGLTLGKAEQKDAERLEAWLEDV
jgi:hypothetical protein